MKAGNVGGVMPYVNVAARRGIAFVVGVLR